MMLNDIVRKVLARVSERIHAVPLDLLRERIRDAGPVREFLGSLRKTQDREGAVRVIAEVKGASPSKGVIREHLDPVAIALEYEENGASAVSVLTEQDYFLGDPEFLRRIRERVAIPLLRKDFILQPYQVWEARVLGADAFLLIAALLPDPMLDDLVLLGRDLGMTALVEVHNEAELSRVLATSAEVIGINNRDLSTFTTDLQTTLRLVKRIPEGKIVVSESGIRSPSDLEILGQVGVDAVLVGEILMRAPRPGEKLRELLGRRERL